MTSPTDPSRYYSYPQPAAPEPDACADVVTRADYRRASGASPLAPGEPNAVEVVRRMRDGSPRGKAEPRGFAPTPGSCPDPAAHDPELLERAKTGLAYLLHDRDRLQAENQRLREALEGVSSPARQQPGAWSNALQRAGKIADVALDVAGGTTA